MGVFIKQNGQWTLCKDIKEGGSTNDALEALGYDTNQFYSYMNYNEPYDYGEDLDNILTVCLKSLSEEIICVITCPGRKILTDSDVQYYMRDFDFSRDYSLYSMESDLDSAIAAHNYSIQFVGDALGVPYSSDDKIIYSSRFKYNFIFEGGYLVGYEIADGYNREAHEMKDQGSWIYNLIETHAQKFYGVNDDSTIKEINIQAKAFYNLPAGSNNEYLPEFKNSDGSYNFKMLLVAKYQDSEYEQSLSYEECKCICHNELKFEGNDEVGLDKIVKYRYRNYIIAFDDKGNFQSCEYNYKPSSSIAGSNSQEVTDSTQSNNSGCMVAIMAILSAMVMMLALFILV